MRVTGFSSSVVVLAVVFGLALPVARAQEPGVQTVCVPEIIPAQDRGEYCPEREQDWKLILAPYFWAASIKGSVDVKGRVLSADASFGKLLKHLDAAFIGHAELHKGNFFILSDTNFFKLSIPGSVNKTVLAPQNPDVVVHGNIDASVSTVEVIEELFAGYCLFQRQLNCSGEPPREFRIDGLAGMRYFYLDTKLDANATIDIIGPQQTKTVKRSVHVSDSVDWVNAAIGARAKWDLTDRFSIGARGDVGGTAGNSSWSAVADAQYKLNDCWTLVGGYKIVKFKHEMGDATMDLKQYGPAVAIVYNVSF